MSRLHTKSFMQRRPHRFGATETTIYRRLVQQDAPKLLTTAQAMSIVGRADPNSLSHSMSSLVSKNVLMRLGKGVYLNQSTGAAPKIVEVIPSVFHETDYYLGLNAAANHWGLSPQIPYAYHVIYRPENKAQLKKIRNWSSMLKKYDKELGGIIVPVVSWADAGSGSSQTIVDGAQLPVSILERTIVDSVIYTKQIGGSGEAILWAMSALTKITDYYEFERIVSRVYPKINSLAARLGFLLETASNNRRPENQKGFSSFISKLKLKTFAYKATYNWGAEKRSSIYVPKWRLHVAQNYVRELKEAVRRYE